MRDTRVPHQNASVEPRAAISYIKAQPPAINPSSFLRCLWSFSYIKPQLLRSTPRSYEVVYGLFPTSNHNLATIWKNKAKLFMVFFLHQTTTIGNIEIICRKLFMVFFLHQTTTTEIWSMREKGCLWSFSYIKPQLPSELMQTSRVVYGLFPTSNHNLGDLRWSCNAVVYGLFPTSNHNRSIDMITESLVVYGLFPTSNHNRQRDITERQLLFMVFFLHQTTTSLMISSSTISLFMVFFLHQTTTQKQNALAPLSCLWSFSYIKPQLTSLRVGSPTCCLWSFSYIKPQPHGGSWSCRCCCLWSFSYIKPQLLFRPSVHKTVVYGLFPTSNHNVEV